MKRAMPLRSGRNISAVTGEPWTTLSSWPRALPLGAVCFYWQRPLNRLSDKMADYRIKLCTDGKCQGPGARLCHASLIHPVPFLGLKVVVAIHWEALKLWLKGVNLRPRPAHRPQNPPSSPGQIRKAPHEQSPEHHRRTAAYRRTIFQLAGGYCAG